MSRDNNVYVHGNHISDKNWGTSLKNTYNSCWYNRFQAILCLLAFLTFGIGDTFTSIWMIEEKGILREGNIIVQYIVFNYGVSEFILIKTCVTIILLIIPFLMKDVTYWMINGYSVSFIIAGGLGIFLNLQAAGNEQPLMSPEQAIFIFIGLVLLLTNLGAEIDKRMQPKIRPHIACLLNDIITVLSAIFFIFKKRNIDKNK